MLSQEQLKRFSQQEVNVIKDISVCHSGSQSYLFALVVVAEMGFPPVLLIDQENNVIMAANAIGLDRFFTSDGDVSSIEIWNQLRIPFGVVKIETAALRELAGGSEDDEERAVADLRKLNSILREKTYH